LARSRKQIEESDDRVDRRTVSVGIVEDAAHCRNLGQEKEQRSE